MRAATLRVVNIMAKFKVAPGFMNIELFNEIDQEWVTLNIGAAMRDTDSGPAPGLLKATRRRHKETNEALAKGLPDPHIDFEYKIRGSIYMKELQEKTKNSSSW